MIFFSRSNIIFKGNLKRSYDVKVFLVDITILSRGILFVKFGLWRALNVESRPSDIPPRYVLSGFPPHWLQNIPNLAKYLLHYIITEWGFMFR